MRLRRYCLITPCRDEAKYARRTLDAITMQSALWLGSVMLLPWGRYGQQVISLGSVAYAPWKIPLYLKFLVRRQVERVRSNIESFNGRLGQEYLNTHWFLSLEDARRRIEDWCRTYNETRPHSAPDWSTPAEFARSYGLKPAATGTREPEISTIDRS